MYLRHRGHICTSGPIRKPMVYPLTWDDSKRVVEVPGSNRVFRISAGSLGFICRIGGDRLLCCDYESESIPRARPK